MRIDETDIEVFLETLENYIERVIYNKMNPSIQAVTDVNYTREVVKSFLMEKAGLNVKEEEPKPVYEGVKCPECGGEMVSRKGKYGVFWGCKKYPKCNGTRDSEGKSREDRDREKREREAQVVEPIDERFRFRKG